jgi:hypothetical protein
MADVKDLLKKLTEQAGKLQGTSKTAAENIAKVVEAAKGVSKTQSGGKG